MNGIWSCLTSKYSAIVLPLIALALVQIIQGVDPHFQSQSQSDFPPLQTNEEYYEYYRNYYDSLQNIGDARAKGKRNRNLPPKNNITSRDYTPTDSPKTVSLPDISNSKPGSGIIAYHRSLHNVSWAVTIPLFSFLLPIADSGDPVSLQNQALYGFFSALIVIIGFGVPILFNGQIPGARSLDSAKVSLNHLMHPGHLVNLVGANMQNQIGIDPMQCLQKTICEAYRSPRNDRYGMLTWPVKYFFPAKNVSDENSRSIYEIAARDGKFTDASCGKKYDCMFDVLSLANYFITAYQRSRLPKEENDL